MLQLEAQLASLAAAVSQLELALRESAAPVNELGAALERACLGLERVRAGAESDTTAEPLRTECRRVLREMSTCIESLQFYDRMVQHLALVQQFIAAATDNAASPRDSAALSRLHVGEGTIELF